MCKPRYLSVWAYYICFIIFNYREHLQVKLPILVGKSVKRVVMYSSTFIALNMLALVIKKYQEKKRVQRINT